MSRRVNSGGSSDVPADNYLGRLVKYIPSEIIALYVAAGGYLTKDPDGHLIHPKDLLWIFLACQILTPLYIWWSTYVRQKPLPWVQIILATIAFFVWVLAIGGPIKIRPEIASIVLVFTTFVLGTIPPNQGS